MNYLTYPYKSAKHLHGMDTALNFNKRRFITLKGGDESRISFVTVQDFAQVVAKAIDYEGEWPTTGGFRGSEVSIAELIKLGEKVRGEPFEVTHLEREDILAGEWKAPWTPVMDHPSLTKEQVEGMSKHITGRILLSFNNGGWAVGDEWNRIFPELKTTKLEDFLEEAWKGKP